MPFHRRRPRLAVLLGATAALAVGPVMAAPAPPYRVLLQQAQTASPRLAEAGALIERAEGAARQAAARPNPVLGLEVENFGGGGPFEGLSGADTTASIQQAFELGGKRPARVAAGRAEVVAARATADQARVDFAVALANAYAEAEAAVALTVLAEDLLAAAAEDARAARALVDAGREAELRGIQATADRRAAEADVDAARATQAAAFARLSALAGETRPFDSVAEPLLTAPVSANSSVDVEAPSVVAARAERDAAAARVRSERLRGRPDLTVSAGVRRMAGDDATALVAGVSIPLPVFDRNLGATQSAQAELAAAEARLRQAELDALADRRTAEGQARSAASRVEAAVAVESAAGEAYRMARLGYEAGRLPLLELTGARRSLAAARTRTIEARLARVRAEAELARLSGRVPFGD